MNMIGPIPQIGYGSWNRPGDECYTSIRMALDAGYRHIDTAEGYNNEEFVGKAVAESGVKRADIFITTKVAPEHLGPGQVMPHVKVSLDKLRLEQVDLLLVHWPSIKDQYDITDYMTQFAEVFDKGLAKHIGVSNFTKRHLDAAITILGHRPITTNQVEIHPLMQNRVIVDYTRSKKISTTAYSPLARGAVNNNETLIAIGKTHKASPGQIALAFLMAEGHIVIPSSGSKQRIEENLASQHIQLSADDVTAIRGIDAGHRLVNGDWCPVWDK
jgi:2,5-diketo-D-gluconate reductase B